MLDAAGKSNYRWAGLRCPEWRRSCWPAGWSAMSASPRGCGQGAGCLCMLNGSSTAVRSALLHSSIQHGDAQAEGSRHKYYAWCVGPRGLPVPAGWSLICRSEGCDVQGSKQGWFCFFIRPEQMLASIDHTATFVLHCITRPRPATLGLGPMMTPLACPMSSC